MLTSGTAGRVLVRRPHVPSRLDRPQSIDRRQAIQAGQTLLLGLQSLRVKSIFASQAMETTPSLWL